MAQGDPTIKWSELFR